MSRHPLVPLVDETLRLSSRLRSVFADARKGCGLNDSEQMVLNSVVEAARANNRALTVAQIARSMGFDRQRVQRAANSLRQAGLLEAVANPDHKRAVLLGPTAEGLELKRRIDIRADAIAAELMPSLDEGQVSDATVILNGLRKQIEAHFRTAGNPRGDDHGS